MTKISCTRALHFCTGHRVMNHEGKCATVHGHNFVAYITVETEQMDAVGRVIDFSILKKRIGEWIDRHWDHNFLVWKEDKEVIDALFSIPRTKDPYICPFNPTVENMAIYLLKTICPELLEGTNVTVTKIVLFETKSCFAEVSLN